MPGRSLEQLQDQEPEEQELLPEGSEQEDNVSLQCSSTASPISLLNDDSMQESRRGLNYLNGLALVIGLQFGSGIFSAPSQVTSNVASPTHGILVWLLAGILVWTGAASLIELASAIPRNGGIQEYLRICYGDGYGFLFSWVWILVVKPTAIAMTALIFAEYLGSVVLPDHLNAVVVVVVKKLVALLGIGMIAALNCANAHAGARVANGFLVVKLIAVFSIGLTGLVLGISRYGEGVNGKEHGWFTRLRRSEVDPLPVVPPVQVTTSFGGYVTALFGSLFCYGGWENIGFVAGEMTDPSTSLPRVIHTAMAISVVGFALMNMGLYIEIPMAEIAASNTVAVAFGRHVFGTAGGLIYSLTISISCLGALNANIFAMGRLIFTASNRRFLPKALGTLGWPSRENQRQLCGIALPPLPLQLPRIADCVTNKTVQREVEKAPVLAILFSAALAAAYVLIGSFQALLTFIGITEYIFFLFMIAGVFRLRARSPPLERPYKTWTINPIVFCVTSGLLVVRGIAGHPLQGIVIAAISMIGWLVWMRRLRSGMGPQDVS